MGDAARHRPSRRVAAERDGRGRRLGAPARLRRREGDDGRARHARRHVQGQARVLGARAGARQGRTARATSTRSRSCSGSCSSVTACTAPRRARRSSSRRSWAARCRRSPKRSRTRPTGARSTATSGSAARADRADRAEGPRRRILAALPAAAEMEHALTKAVPPASAVRGRRVGEVARQGLHRGSRQGDRRRGASWRRAAGSAPGRKTPLPIRLATVPGTVRTDAKHPPAPETGSSRTIMVVLGALVVLLGVGVVFAMQSRSGSTPATEARRPLRPRRHLPPGGRHRRRRGGHRGSSRTTRDRARAGRAAATEPAPVAAAPAAAPAQVPNHEEAADLGSALAGPVHAATPKETARPCAAASR